MSNYQASHNRYEQSRYSKCGNSGLKLPYVSLGLWHNFGGQDNQKTALDMLLRAFDLGITHFDLANNYGPPAGSAESFFGEVISGPLKPYRDELIVSTKAGYGMWPGPYGDWGSRKYLVASLDQSLQRMQLDYVDIFYHHRRDTDTPLEETMQTLSDIVRNGKALYVGLSNYNAADLLEANSILSKSGTPCIVNQPKFSMLDRTIEQQGVLDAAKSAGIGTVPFSPLAQGLLSNKYLNGIPKHSRASNPDSFLQSEQITQEVLNKVTLLNELAQQRGQSLPQLAISWIHAKPSITSCIIGASKVSQIEELVATQHQAPLTEQEMKMIDVILTSD
ncbi:aldo/keto reductase [Aliiglaciecola sp. LCG003]|uniref:aldo/keto reductase n=1 Tax=Aliiglaciecola sp. LCG003 TaxID=3053655 RepID=UPI002573F15E|nr:aldo/keto reductase [Aliiglaciecola sp. LCG003]WJG10871.1 aldo/keto reductase [Aliiglaciecola sp. LCG003]